MYNKYEDINYWKEKSKAYHLYLVKCYAKNYPERIKANKLVKNYPKKEFCEKCGSNKFIIKHHSDYNKPLEIVYLCRKCHAIIHNCKNIIKKEVNNEKT